MRLAEIFSSKFKTKISERTIKNILDWKHHISEMISSGFGDLLRKPNISYDIFNEKVNEFIRDLENKGAFL